MVDAPTATPIALASVVLAVRNGAPIVVEQLEALAAQTHAEPWELVVVDNGSTDDTVELVHGFVDRIPGLRVVSADAKAGLSYARNTGVAESTGDYVFFVDHDDRVGADWLRAMVRAGEHADCVGGNSVHFVVEPDGTERVRKPPYEDHPMHGFGFLPSITGGNCGMRTRVFLELGGFNESYGSGEDVELFWRAMLAGHDVAFARDAMLEYRLRAGLRANWRQSFRDATVCPLLYRDFHAVGMPRSSARDATDAWVQLLTRAPRALVRGSDALVDWVREVALRAGRARGSVKYRALYL